MAGPLTGKIWDKLLRRTIVIDRNRITADCIRGFGFLADLTDDERMLANDPHQRERGSKCRVLEGI
jgi:hypothetical protein